MYIVYWVVLILSAPIAGMKLAQLQHCYKHWKILHPYQRQMMIGAFIMFLASVSALLWALYSIWVR